MEWGRWGGETLGSPERSVKTPELSQPLEETEGCREKHPGQGHVSCKWWLLEWNPCRTVAEVISQRN